MTTSAKVPADLRRFAAEHEGIDAVIQRIGRGTWDLLLIDGEGNWTRAVYLTKEQCQEVAEQLGVTVHDGWDDESIAKRMNRRDHWNEPGGQRRAL
ncbi:MAG: hypothetical protein M3Q23_01300 [Actinomycetota bacterium]|nr:hypothetical protein [Actinomycetota bacterium]